MSPVGIVLYEIDPSFGPNVLAEYYLSQSDKITSEILKEFVENHIDKEFLNSTTRRDELRYYSTKIDAKSIKKENLFLAFILKEGEDLVSLKSVINRIAEMIIQNFAEDKVKMGDLLKVELNSIFSLMEKLQEPALVKETINEKTKKMIDDGKLQEARELINLGEEIPEKLADEIKVASQFLKEKFYKKAKKSLLRAAELANLIQEEEIVSFLENKAEQVGIFPDLLKEQETLYKDIEKIIEELHQNKLHLYHEIIKPVNRLINISNSFEEHELSEKMIQLSNEIKQADQMAKELFSLDKKIKDFFETIQKEDTTN